MTGPQAVLLDLTCAVQGIYADGDFQFYLSWSGYAIVGGLYSVIVLIDEIPKCRRVFSTEQSNKTCIDVLLIHSLFLAVLFWGIREAPRFALYLPPWMTKTRDMGDGYCSIAECLFCLGAVLLAAIERIWLTWPYGVS